MGANAPGELIHAITTAVLASFIVTWVLLAGYRRAVARTMRTASAQAERAPSIELPVAPPAPLVRPAIDAIGDATTTGAGLWRGFRPVGAGACAAAHLENRPGVRRRVVARPAFQLDDDLGSVRCLALCPAGREPALDDRGADRRLVAGRVVGHRASRTRQIDGRQSLDGGLGSQCLASLGAVSNQRNTAAGARLYHRPASCAQRPAHRSGHGATAELSAPRLQPLADGECAGHLHCEPDADVAGDEYRNVYRTGFAIPVVERSGRPSRVVAVAASGASVREARIQQRATGG